MSAERPYDVDCPFCGAEAGDRCLNMTEAGWGIGPDGGRFRSLLSEPHDDRVQTSETVARLPRMLLYDDHDFQYAGVRRVRGERASDIEWCNRCGVVRIEVIREEYRGERWWQRIFPYPVHYKMYLTPQAGQRPTWKLDQPQCRVLLDELTVRVVRPLGHGWEGDRKPEEG